MADDAQRCTIAEGVTINGRVSGRAPVDVTGRIEGSVSLEERLTIEAGGEVVAEVEAREIVVRGRLDGDLVAHNAITLEAGSVVTGNIRAPRLVIAEGARFRGNIDMDVDA